MSIPTPPLATASSTTSTLARRSPSAASAESSMHNSKASECVAASPKVYRHNRPTAYFSPMISLLLPVRFSVTASVA
jgi:hypothetical protein